MKKFFAVLGILISAAFAAESFFSNRQQLGPSARAMMIGLALCGIAIIVLIIDVGHRHYLSRAKRIWSRSNLKNNETEREYLDWLMVHLKRYPEWDGKPGQEAHIIPLPAHPRKTQVEETPLTKPVQSRKTQATDSAIAQLSRLYRYDPIDYVKNRELRQAELYTRMSFGRRTRIKDLAGELRRQRKIVVLGDPGAGKSVCLRKLAYDICSDELAKEVRLPRIPIYVEMKTYDGWDSDSEAPAKPLAFLQSSLRRLAKENDGHRDALLYVAEQLPRLLREGRATLIFDALDEMPQDSYLERYRALKTFTGEWEERGSNQFVFSCRLLDYDEAFVVGEVIIDPLDLKKIKEYLKQNAGLSAQLIEQRIEDDETVRELVSNPFYLAALTYVSRWRREAEEQLRIPTSPGELIATFAKALLDNEANKKQAESVARIKGGLATLETFLSEIGFSLQERRSGRTSALVTDLQDIWTRYPQWREMLLIGQRANILGQRGVVRDNLPLLKARAEVIAEHGLVDVAQSEFTNDGNGHEVLPAELFVAVKTVEDIEPPQRIEFKHHRLQEYFAARELARRLEAGEPVERYLDDVWWQETVILAVGIVDDPGSIIERMLAPQADTSEWISEVLVEAGRFKPQPDFD